MAQKQIALQQVRTGKQRDLPDAMEKGQIGFSTDECRVFIGLPSSSEPASLVAGRTWTTDPNSGKENVEIITEFSPWDVVTDIVNKPVVLVANAAVSEDESTDTDVMIRGRSRIFLDYIAYDNDTNTILETGSVQMVSVNSQVLIAQTNNTNQNDGIVYITFLDPKYDSSSERMTITINNTNTSSFTLECILRGWDKP